MTLESMPRQPSSPVRRVFASVLAYAAVIAILVNVAGVLIGSARYPDYSQVRDTLSVLGRLGSPSNGVMQPFEVAYFVLLLLFAVQLYSGARAASMRTIALLIVFAVVCGLLVDLVFRLHYPLDEHRARNGVHTLLAVVSAIAMETSIFLAYRYFAATEYRRFARFSLACLVTTAVFMLLTLISLGQTLHAYAGLFERITLGVGLIWVVVFNIVAARSGFLRMPGLIDGSG